METLNAWWAAAWPWLAIVLGFGGLIFIHELGHFLAAKWVGVKVEVFALFFGPALVHATWGGTRYQIGCLPIGGYVKMKGEEGATGDGPPDADSFAAQRPGQRALVLIAGVTMNAVSAFVCFIVAFRVGVVVPDTVIGEVSGHSAWEAGLARGDRIVRVGGEDVHSFPQMLAAVAHAEREAPLEVVVERPGPGGPITRTFLVTPRYDEEVGIQDLGVSGARTNVAAGVQPDEAGARAGLRDGDRLVAVGAVPTADQRDILRAVRSLDPRRPVRLTVERDGARVVLDEAALSSRVDWDLGLWTAPALRVEAVLSGSAAEQAGLRAGEWLCGWRLPDDEAPRPLGSLARFEAMLLRRAGQPLVLRVSVDAADGPEREVALTVPDSAELGLRMKEPEGHAVAAVDPAGPAAAAGLQAGDRVQAARVNVKGAAAERWPFDYLALEPVPAPEGVPLPTWPFVVTLAAGVACAFGSRRLLAWRGLPADSPRWGPLPRLLVAMAGTLVVGGAAFGLATLTADAPPPAAPGFRLTMKHGGESEEHEVAVPNLPVALAGFFHQLPYDEGETPAIVALEIERDLPGGETAHRTIEFRPVADPADAYGFIGMGFQERRVQRQTPNLLEAGAWGVDATRRMVAEVGRMFRSLIWRRNMSVKVLGGPGTIGYVTHRAAAEGLGNWLNILGIIGVNLAVINLLPIPALDGGHLLFVLVEKLRGRPVGEVWQARFLWAGVAALLALMALVLFNDVTFLSKRFG